MTMKFSEISPDRINDAMGRACNSLSPEPVLDGGPDPSELLYDRVCADNSAWPAPDTEVEAIEPGLPDDDDLTRVCRESLLAWLKEIAS